MINIPHEEFQTQCDRLSKTVDAAGFERLRFARTEAPMLARLVELAQGAVEEREDFELAEEGSTADTKRFVLKVHGTRVISIALGLDGPHVRVWADTINRSAYTLTYGDAIVTDFAAVNEAWMAAALMALFARVEL